ncbi:hypothetical protein [Paenibacillus sp. UMB4589-SE434]|uniref:hypothetical protein n=1 Tax=Paenibacillus sp. UMB4589-SE434 TaxID=3046314 RepID=UPI00254EBCFD|nr:hypothetical protein [Paenibacillus sp. UMB4589-SE434]MDK8182034.1 hypothetical protein [Paenibacillus sp. UMB4589-SE434]
MWADIATFLKANASETLLISIIGTILVWMYKQFKGMIDSKQQRELAIVQLKQGLFTKLELSIANVLNQDNEVSKQQLYALLGECGPYLTSTQRTVIRDYYKQVNPLLLHTLQALIVSEVDKLGRQLGQLREDEENTEWLIYIQRLYAPFGPIILFLIITLYIVFIYQLVKQGASLWIQICILLLGVTIFLSATLFIAMLYFIFRGELGKQGAKRWYLIAAIIVSPALAFVVNRVDMFTVVFGIQLLGLIIVSRSKRPLEIIKP